MDEIKTLYKILKSIIDNENIQDYSNIHDDLDIDLFYYKEIEHDIKNSFNICHISSSEWENFWRSNPTVYELYLFIKSKMIN